MIDVAKLAGVTPSTVSRVLTGNAKISDITKEKVMAAIKQLNYRPDVVARSLVKQKSDTIGLVIPRNAASIPSFTMMVEACQQVLGQYGKELFICQAHDRSNSHQEIVNTLIDRGCDGILFFHNFFFEKENINSESLSKLIDQLPIPMVVMNSILPRHPFHCVWIDHKVVASLAVDYAISKGNTNIAYISGPLWQDVARWRLQGYQSSLEKNQIPYNSLLIVEGDRTIEGGYNAYIKLIERRIPFSAICCFNDYTAIGVAKAFGDDDNPNKKHPLIVGIDNLPILNYFLPKISSVEIPMDELATCAVELLMMHLGDDLVEAVPSRGLIGELVIR